jgi:hypothetical protein
VTECGLRCQSLEGIHTGTWKLSPGSFTSFILSPRSVYFAEGTRNFPFNENKNKNAPPLELHSYFISTFS